MPVLSLPGVQSQYATGERTGDYIAKAADAAANFACSLYKNYPGTIVPNPAEATIRGLWDGLCKDRPSGLPSPPTPQLPGGQCVCVPYSVSYTYSDPDAPVSGSGTITVNGPIRGVRVVAGVGAENRTWLLVSTDCDGSGNPVGEKAGDILYSGSKNATVTVTGVSRVDGQSDTCGNAAPAYPPETYYPPDGYNSGTGQITYNDGTDLTVPLVFAPVSATAELKAEFNVDVGGINFKFDLGGVKVDLGNGDKPLNEPRDRYNDNSDDFDRINHRIDDLTDKVDDISRRLPDGSGGGDAPPPPAAKPPDSDPNLEPDQKQPDDPKDETGVTKLKWVKIILTKLPDKVQFGDGAPNCYFAGWLEFKSGTSCYSREQINFQTSLFLAPAGADGYAYTLTNGAEGYAIVYRSKD